MFLVDMNKVMQKTLNGKVFLHFFDVCNRLHRTIWPNATNQPNKTKGTVATNGTRLNWPNKAHVENKPGGI